MSSSYDRCYMSQEKEYQLGMTYGKAYNRLLKDILWMLIVEADRYKCCRCGQCMTREDFTIEHIEPWLHSEDPIKLFFSLENIGFSHYKCNIAARRNSSEIKPPECGTNKKYDYGCRCDKCKEASSIYRKSIYTTDKRRKKHLKYKLKNIPR